jgi:hypothetical protein
VKRNAIEVTLPEECDKGMQRDGVEPKPYYQNAGEKGWWLQQMLRLVPPKVWAEESGWAIGDLIEAAKHSKWKNVLLEGWTQATLLCQDVEWADALITETASDKMQSLFQTLPQARQEAFIIKLLKADPDLNYAKPAYTCIACCDKQWGEKLSRAVIDSLVHTAKNSPKNNYWIWTAIGNSIGRHLDPALIPEAVTRLTQATKSMPERQSQMEPFLNLIQFRHEMLKEL